MWYLLGWEWVPKSTLKACLLITHNMLPNKYLPTFLNKKLRLNNTFGLPFSLGKFQPLSLNFVSLHSWFTIMKSFKSLLHCFSICFFFCYFCRAISEWKALNSQNCFYVLPGRTNRGVLYPPTFMNNELVVWSLQQFPPHFKRYIYYYTHNNSIYLSCHLMLYWLLLLLPSVFETL